MDPNNTPQDPMAPPVVPDSPTPTATPAPTAPVEPQTITPTVTPQPVASQPAVIEPTAQAPAPVGQPVATAPSPTGPSPVTPTPVSGGSKKNLAFGLIAAALVVGGALGYYFLSVVPNKPENVWRTGLSRSGEVTNKLVVEAIETEKREKIEQSKISGTFEFKSGESDNEFVMSGDVNSLFDLKRSNSSLSLKVDPSADAPEGTEGLDLKAEVISEITDESNYPNLYFKVTGLEYYAAMLGEDFMKYDGRWIAMTSDYFENQAKQYGAPEVETEETGVSDLTAEEVSNMVKAVSDTAVEYVFTDDESKGIIRQKEFVGKEDSDGINAYHYKAGIKVDNLQKACKALINNVFAVSGFEKFFGGDSAKKDKARDDALESCDEEISEEDRKEAEDYTFDLWVDSKYKLLHKIRFAEENKPDSYFEVGQTYTGGEDITFFMNVIAKNDDGVVEVNNTLKANYKTWKTEYSLDASGKGFSGSAKVTMEPYYEDIDTARPDDAIDISEVFGPVVEGTTQANGPTQGSSPLTTLGLFGQRAVAGASTEEL